MLVETRAQAKWRDEQEQADLSIALALSSAEVANAQQHAKPASRKTKPSAQKKKSSGSTQSSSAAAKARRNRRVTKQRLPETETAQTAKSLMVKLPIKYYNIGPKVLREKYGIKLKREKIVHTNKKRFKLGHNPYAGTSLPCLSKDNAALIYNVLVDHNKKFGFGSFVSHPAHATQSRPVVTVDSIIQVMLSQTTANELAIDTHDRLRNRYVYTVDGSKYAGKIPNWHEVRLVPEEDLRDALVPGGQFNKRAKAIKALLDYVYNANVARKLLGKGNYSDDGNPSDARDFVDGMLSMAFITEDYEDNSDQAVLDRLLKLPNFGPKSAMCILAFELKRDLFVVDVHVLRFCKWLGWIPKTATPEDAAMYLHKVIPKDIRYDLHNQIWTHCANENVHEIEIKDEGNEPEQSAGVIDVQTSVASKKGLEQPKLNVFFKAEKSKSASSSEFDVKQKKVVKEKKLRLRRTMLMEELTPEQAKAHSKFLFMFRPLDNSFGQDRGTFESKPRFRWEGSEIMNSDVAFSFEDAQKILKGEVSHPWMKATEEDVTKQQALNAMAAVDSLGALEEGMDEVLYGAVEEEQVEWVPTDDEMDGKPLVDSMDEDTWEDPLHEDSSDDTSEEMRTWQIDNLQ
ncbi:hypothetical protein LTR24_005242 [Lithohypha guttulata]|uniref:HhH-GPD domain-containing protein n=1 Tax=Lithohypha guttulata TaxID=1690604 RepID=A0ABR0K9Z0_9EURO|nr:hypothetical protein LTR24_005242 [Lithohypha guttulata]